MADSPQSLSLDPLHTFTSFESQFYTAIYEGLVVADPQTLEPVPGVARSWESSENGKVWTFHLRPDALFSNGDRVRARDFVASWLRMIDPANNAEYSFFYDVIKGAHAYRTGTNKDRLRRRHHGRQRRRAAHRAGIPGGALPEAPHAHQLPAPAYQPAAQHGVGGSLHGHRQRAVRHEEQERHGDRS